MNTLQASKKSLRLQLDIYWYAVVVVIPMKFPKEKERTNKRKNLHEQEKLFSHIRRSFDGVRQKKRSDFFFLFMRNRLLRFSWINNLKEPSKYFPSQSKIFFFFFSFFTIMKKKKKKNIRLQVFLICKKFITVPKMHHPSVKNKRMKLIHEMQW